jgi:hypothetical protein
VLWPVARFRWALGGFPGPPGQGAQAAGRGEGGAQETGGHCGEGERGPADGAQHRAEAAGELHVARTELSWGEMANQQVRTAEQQGAGEGGSQRFEATAGQCDGEKGVRGEGQHVQQPPVADVGQCEWRAEHRDEPGDRQPPARPAACLPSPRDDRRPGPRDHRREPERNRRAGSAHQ